MNIDWIEGATHYGIGDDCPVFFRNIIKGESYEFKNVYSSGIMADWLECTGYIDIQNGLVERPKKQGVWDGVCIPPIDSECKVVEGLARWEHSGMSDWIGRNVKVKSTFINNIGQQIASVESDNSECACFIVECLRPIKTAEQLAEEEREKEAIELYLTMQPASNSKAWDNIGDYARDRYRLAISSGYRKQ